jgi:hypothetical protein
MHLTLAALHNAIRLLETKPAANRGDMVETANG